MFKVSRRVVLMRSDYACCEWPVVSEASARRVGSRANEGKFQVKNRKEGEYVFTFHSWVKMIFDELSARMGRLGWRWAALSGCLKRSSLSDWCDIPILPLNTKYIVVLTICNENPGRT